MSCSLLSASLRCAQNPEDSAGFISPVLNNDIIKPAFIGKDRNTMEEKE